MRDEDWREGMSPQEILRAVAAYWSKPGVGLTAGERREMAAYLAGAEALEREAAMREYVFACEKCGGQGQVEIPKLCERCTPKKPVTAWLIESSVDGRPHWWTARYGKGWTTDACKAIWFMRKLDAAAVASFIIEPGVQKTVTEHMFW